MKELIYFAFLPVNTYFTILLLLMTLYWLMVIIGLLDINLFNIDFDSNGEVDVDAEIASGGLFHSILQFFYIGEVPVMLMLSILILCMWAFVITGNYYFNRNGSFLHAIPIYLVSFVATAVTARIFMAPLKKIYIFYNKDYNETKDVVGRMCCVTTTEVTAEKMGQAEVKTKGAPIILNVITRGDSVLKKGDKAVVLERNEAKGIYYIVPANLEV